MNAHLPCLMIKYEYWRHMFVVKRHASSGDGDIRDRFYEKLRRLFDQFPVYHMKNLFEDLIFNAELERQDIL